MGTTLEDAAVDASGLAAQAAGECDLSVDLVHGPAEATAAAELLHEIWRTPHGAPVAPELFLALAHTGNYAAVARRGEELIAASAAFRTGDAVPRLHSHITGVVPGQQGRSVGYAMKLHQRAWALGQGISCISWTFDPLQRRNASFNLARLGARFAFYLPDFYGVMADEINRGGPSDRALLEWDLTRPLPDRSRPALAESDEAPPLVRVDAHGIPQRAGAGQAPVVSIPVPPDIGALRRADPDLATRWHLTVRDAFLDALATGYAVTGFDPARSYILRRLDDHAP